MSNNALQRDRRCAPAPERGRYTSHESCGRLLREQNMAIPDDHREYLTLKFVTDVDLSIYAPSDRAFLEKYGAWLKALMLRKIKPITDAQRAFIDFCYGKRRPETEAEHVWKRHQIDLMYLIAKECEYHIGSRFTAREIARLFQALAAQGHGQAINRPDTASVRTTNPPPLINIAAIYPRNLQSNDVMSCGRMASGSYGSRQ